MGTPEVTNEVTPDDLPDSVWDRYIGERVCIQLKLDYFNVTSPGVFAQTAPGHFLTAPLLVGIFGVQRDKRGGIRVTVTMKDPNPEVNTLVHTSLDPISILAITVAQEQAQQSLIIQPGG
jgi:hypothetical protein